MAEVEALLEEFADAMVDERQADAERIATEVAAELDDTGEERSAIVRSRLARDFESADVDVDATEALHGHVASGMTTQLTRMKVLATLGAMAADPDSVSEQEVRTEIDALGTDLETATAALAEDAETARTVRDGISLAPRVAIQSLAVDSETRTVAPGETVALAVTVENVGDEPGTDISVEATSVDGVEAVSDGETVDVLEGGETHATTVDVRLADDASRTESVEVSVTSADAGTDASRLVLVREQEVETETETEESGPRFAGVSVERILAGGAVTAGMLYLAVKLRAGAE